MRWPWSQDRGSDDVGEPEPHESSPLTLDGQHYGSYSQRSSRNVTDGEGRSPSSPASPQPLLATKPPFSPYLLLPLQLLSIFSFSLNSTLRDQFILHRVCRQYATDHGLGFDEPADGSIHPLCRSSLIMEQVSSFQRMFLLTITIPALFAIAIYGRLSDHPKFGRKTFAMLDLLGVLLQVLWLLVVHYCDLRTGWMLVGSSVMGLLGGGGMYEAMFYAMASDYTTAGQRTSFFSIAQVMFLSGTALAPLVMSGAVELLGNLYGVFWIIAPSLAISLVYLALLPYKQEFPTYAPKPREVLNVFGSLRVLSKTTDQYSHYVPPRSALTYSWFVVQLNFTGLFIILIPYTTALFGWNAVDDGLVLSSAAAAKVVFLLFFSPLIARWLTGWYHMRKCADHDQWTRADERCQSASKLYAGLKVDFLLTRASLFWYTLCYSLFGLTTHPSIFILIFIVDSFGIILIPSARSAMTKLTPPHLHGTFLAAISLLNSIGNVVADVLFTGLYRATVSWYPAASLFLMSALFASALFGVAFVGIRQDMVLRQIQEPPEDADGRAGLGR